MKRPKSAGDVAAGDRALREQPLLERGRSERLGRFLLDAVDDLGRRPGRREQAEPRARLESLDRPGFGDRRHVGQRRAALAAGHRERDQLAALDLRQRRRQVVEHQVHRAADQVEQRRPRAAVREVDHVGAGHRLEELARQVDRGAVAARRHVELARVGARVGDQRAHVGDAVGGRLRRVHDEDVRHAGDERDRREVLDRVVGHLRIQRRIDRLRADRSHQQRVAVGRRLGDEIGAQVAAGAGLVLDDEALAEGLGELGRERAGEDVGRAAPGLKGTTMRTGLLGHAPWARTQGDAAAARPRPTSERRRSDMSGDPRPDAGASRRVWRRRPARERGLARRLSRRSPRKQRRRSGTTGRGSLSKSPDCPLLLDAASAGGGEPVRPVPGASEWESLARVRRGVLKPIPQRRPPGGPNKDSCRGTCTRPIEHARALRDRDQRRRRRARTAAAADQRDGDEGGRAAWRSKSTGPSRPERRGALGAARHADDVLDAGTARMARFRPAARARRGDALRHGAEAEAKQRRRAAVAARAGGAAQRRRKQG